MALRYVPVPGPTASSSIPPLPKSRLCVAAPMAAVPAAESRECDAGGGGAAIDLTRYPIPVTPVIGATEIEYDRAMVAESAMKSGPAIGAEAVLFQDEWLLVINKPGGVYSEHVLVSVPTLSGDTYSSQYPIEKSRGFFHLVNRLDRDTSGIIVVARDKAAAGKLTNTFKSRELSKSYIALCSGKPPHWNRAVVESGHGRSRRGCWRVYSRRDVDRSLPDGSVVKDMVTRFEIDPAQVENKADKEQGFEINPAEELAQVKNEEQRFVVDGETIDRDGDDEVVVRAAPLTGRTHQIRLHCQFLGLPIVGDVRYGGPLNRNGEQCRGHFLHSESISFEHPMTGKLIKVFAPRPSWFNNYY